MTTAYTSLLGLALPVTGELSGTWGDTVNNSITSLLDSAVAGTTNVSTDGDVTLTTTTGAANTARQAILLFSGARTALRTVTAPAQSKIYTVINATTGGFSVKLVGVGPTTGVTIVAGESAVCAWNGSDFIKISNAGGSGTFTNLTVTGNLTVNSLTTTRVPYASTSGLLVDSANMTFNGTRLTVADLADSGLTSGRVVYASAGGALVDSANLLYAGTDLTVYGIRIGRGNSAIANNLVVGAGTALNAITTGNSNVAIGENSLAQTTTGGNNVSIGIAAMPANTTGSQNVAVGSGVTSVTNGALGTNTTGSFNVAVGVGSLIGNSTTSYNTAVGWYALYANVAATNTAVGAQAGGNNSTGAENTYLGYRAGYTGTTAAQVVYLGTVSGENATGSTNVGVGAYTLRFSTGSNNVSMGYAALATNTSGANNVGLGHGALQLSTTASNNTAVGYQAGYTNTTGAVTAFGQRALFANTTGADNVAVGVQALGANTTGSTNTAVGHQALTTSTTAGANTAVGYLAGGSTTTGGDNTAIGYAAMRSNTTGGSNTAVGEFALFNNTTQTYNTAIGLGALYTNNEAFNVAVGDSAGYANTTGGITAVGSNVLYNNTTGEANVAMGGRVNSISNAAMLSNTTGSYNSAFGVGALQANTTAANNTAVGYQALYSNTVAGSMTALGYQAGYNFAGDTGFCTLLGYRAGYSGVGTGTTSYYNTFVGARAGEAVNGSTIYSGSSNTFVGYLSGSAVTTGRANVILGRYDGNQNGLDIRTASNNIILSDGDGNPRLRGNSSGHWGVNTTPNPNWPSSWTVMQWQGTNAIWGVQGQFQFGYNNYYDSSTYRYGAAGYAHRYLETDTGHIWDSAPSGAADGVITFETQMSIDLQKTLALRGATPQSGTGITFPASQFASSNANTLDDYEEGTWTPVYTGGGISVSYSEQIGRYIKIGKMVYISCRLVTNSASGGSGNLRIDGLPFTTPATGGNPGFMSINFSYNWAGSAILSLIPTTSSTSIDCYTQYAAYNSNTQVQTTALTSSSSVYIIFGGCYEVA